MPSNTATKDPAGPDRPTDFSAPHPSLTPHERLEAIQRKSPSAVVVHEAIRLEGEEELSRPSSSLWWSGLGAGLTMGFSLVAEGIIRAKLPHAPWRELVSALGYSAGFLFVTLGRKQLFTETTVTAALPMFHDGSRASSVGRFWAIVFFANVIGTLLFAGAASVPGLFAEDVRAAFGEIGVKAVEGGFLPILLKGIVAGWLIGLMVWLLPASGAARIFIIIFVTWLIAVAQLAHVIAGSVEVAYAASNGLVGWGTYLLGFLLPAFLGNTIGGALLVAWLNHAQVKDDLSSAS